MTSKAGAARFRAALAALISAFVLSSCAVGHVKTENDSADGAMQRDLAARPGQAAPVASYAAAPSATVATGASHATTAKATNAVPPRSTEPRAATGTGAAAVSRAIDDPANDEGTGGRAYADIRRVQVERSGDVVRVTVTVAGTVPAKLPADEVAGIGIDFFHDQTGESDYQLFADGEPDGWFAYLDTPSGFVRYPGMFDLSGNALVFTLPASSLGDVDHSVWRAFVDWTRNGVPSSQATSDKAPDQGREPAPAGGPG